MKGFKDTTKMQTGHGEGRATKEHWSVPIARKAMGGIVSPLGGSMRPAGMGSMGAGRPIMPRPHVMPNMKPVGGGKIAKLAKGGSYQDASRSGEGSCLMGTGPYSDNEADHPTPRARPGFKKGGGISINPKNKGKFTKKMTGSKTGDLKNVDVQRGLQSDSPETRKEANFARMARRGFKPLAEGGPVKQGLAFNRTPLCGGGRS